MSGEEEVTYGLVMPFVAVQSNGGPFDDLAYSAGYEMGLLDALLGDTYTFGDQPRTIRAANREQADLLAMRHGWRMTVTEYPGAPEWIGAHFIRVDPALDRAPGGAS